MKVTSMNDSREVSPSLSESDMSSHTAPKENIPRKTKRNSANTPPPYCFRFIPCGLGETSQRSFSADKVQNTWLVLTPMLYLYPAANVALSDTTEGD